MRVGAGIANRIVHDVEPEVKALLEDPARLVLVPKKIPESVLRDAQVRVVERWMRGAPGDTTMTGCRVDIHASALQVMLREPD